MDKNESQIIRLALREDIGRGDITTKFLFPGPVKVRAKIIAKEDGVVCGVEVASEVFKAVEKLIREYKGKIRAGTVLSENCPLIRVNCKVKDGVVVKKGRVVCVIEGDARAILTGERTALNFLSRLSGIATLTRKYVDAVRPYKVKILDTRKTAPGLRELEKYAVECGGGVNHRMGLYDQVLVKDNHIKVTSHKSQVTSLKEIITEIRKKTNKKIEIEVESLRQFKEALDGRPDIIMLDNMSISDIKKAVAFKNKLSTKLEVSGGVSLSNVRRIASTGVDMISVGALTHSAPSLDFSLEIV
jgi:nicotinate-nucleotide pyrophosphorylase (carboxylating)